MSELGNKLFRDCAKAFGRKQNGRYYFDILIRCVEHPNFVNCFLSLSLTSRFQSILIIYNEIWTYPLSGSSCSRIRVKTNNLHIETFLAFGIHSLSFRLDLLNCPLCDHSHAPVTLGDFFLGNICLLVQCNTLRNRLVSIFSKWYN